MVDETGQPYAYTGDDPVNSVDPLGLFCLLGTNPGGGCRGGSEARTVANGTVEATECLASGECLTPKGLANAAAGLADQAAQFADNSICDFTSTSGGVSYCPTWSVGTPFPCASPGSYQVGEAAFFGLAFLIPGGGEADATGAATSVAEDGVPLAAKSALQEIDDGTWPPPGVKGGSTFSNDGRGGGQILPTIGASGDPIIYREWDINPAGPAGRDAIRIVTGSNGSAWYTENHYTTFTRIR